MKEPPPKVKKRSRETTSQKLTPSANPSTPNPTKPKNIRQSRTAPCKWDIAAMRLSMSNEGYAESPCGRFRVTVSGKSTSWYVFFIDQEWSAGPHPPEEFILKAKSQAEANIKAIRWMWLFSGE